VYAACHRQGGGESRKWILAKDDLSYHFSSSRFYENGIDEFGFLNNIFTIFNGD
jgi:hypothetical protein